MDMQSNHNPQTGGDTKVPEPPPLEVDIRTMESDIRAFQQGGGEVPTSGVQETLAKQPQAPGAVSGYSGPEKPLFEAPAQQQPQQQAPVPQMPSQQGSTMQVPVEAPQRSGTGKTVLLVIGIVLGIAALGALGYFGFPIIFNLIGK